MTTLARASKAVMPPEVAGVLLDVTPAELQEKRPKAHRSERADDELHLVYQEALPEETQALYLFSRRSGRLARVQLARRLAGVEQIEARLEALQQRYGAPSGVWDCQDAGQLPTRRFAWRQGEVGAMDTYLLLADRVSATLFVARAEEVGASLARAGCKPTPPERFTQFPAVPTTDPGAAGGAREP